MQRKNTLKSGKDIKMSKEREEIAKEACRKYNFCEESCEDNNCQNWKKCLDLADYIEEAIEKALTDKEIEEAHLWETLFKKDGLPKRIDQAKEELDELDEQLDLVKYKPSQKLSDKEKINLRDEIVDVGMMLESLMIIFKVTASSVAMRKLAKMDKLKTYAYGTNRSVGNVENKGKTTYGY